jgi:hypothetical protein
LKYFRVITPVKIRSKQADGFKNINRTSRIAIINSKIEYNFVNPGTGTLSTRSLAFSRASGPFNRHWAVPQLENKSLLFK